MDILLNPVMVAVVLMLVLCLLKVNVFLSIALSALVCGLLGGASLADAMGIFVSGMGGNNEIVFSLLMFGVLAAAMTNTGIGDVLTPRVAKVMGNKGWILLLVLGVMAIISETFILIYVAFVPIIMPPLLPLTNKLKMDRRKIAVVIVGGLQLGYMCFPVGYGLIFQQIIQSEMGANGLAVELSQVWSAAIVGAIAMFIGAAIALYLYRKPRNYYDSVEMEQAAEASFSSAAELPKMEWRHWATLIGAALAVVVQLITDSIALGALCGVVAMVALGAIQWKNLDKTTMDGITSFGFIAFVLMAAQGFAAMSREVGQVDALVSATMRLMGGSKLLGAFIMLMLGLIVTLGIGSSFNTIPIVATIIVPMGMQMGFSTPAIILLIAISAVLGDAGSPASDQTLVPTAALNVDGKHDHIRDTCIPTFLCYNVPLLVVGTIAACLM